MDPSRPSSRQHHHGYLTAFRERSFRCVCDATQSKRGVLMRGLLMTAEELYDIGGIPFSVRHMPLDRMNIEPRSIIVSLMTDSSLCLVVCMHVLFGGSATLANHRTSSRHDDATTPQQYRQQHSKGWLSVLMVSWP